MTFTKAAYGRYVWGPLIPARRRTALSPSVLPGQCFSSAAGPARRPLRWHDGAAVTVVVAAENYPGRPRVGDVIHGAEGDGVLHAGTARREDGAVVSSGGRVLSVVCIGTDLAGARAAAYARIDSIRLPGSHFCTDIGLAAAEGRISL